MADHLIHCLDHAGIVRLLKSVVEAIQLSLSGHRGRRHEVLGKDAMIMTVLGVVRASIGTVGVQRWIVE